MPYGQVLSDLITTSDGVSSAGVYGLKNRLINGDMRIDQRNAGASVTQGTGVLYVTDRFAIIGSVASKFTGQQSSTAPVGFVKSLITTSSSAYTVGASEFFQISQRIEGNNISDLAWGTANAATVTLSFWVRSSLTGTFGGNLNSYSGDVSYPFSYTISSANTWEQKSLTIVGPTTGTFPTDNSGSLAVGFSLGAGATVSGPAGAWSSTLYRSATGATSVVGTNGATFYITGVQLEKGSTATSFDYRPYGTELALCQRYLPRWDASGTNQCIGTGLCYSTTQSVIYLPSPVTLRVPPTGFAGGGTFIVLNASAAGISASGGITFNNGSNAGMAIVAVVSSGLVAGNATQLLGTGGYIYGTGCEL